MAYVLPAAVVWGLVAVIIHPLSALGRITVLASGTYALLFGGLEALAVPFRPVSFAWQVPAHWLKGRSAASQSLIWGTALGPGLVTRNPYAGIWLLPMLLTFEHTLLTAVGMGFMIGVVHGSARALGVLHLRRTGNICGLVVLTQWRWRVADGLLLLLGAGGMLVLWWTAHGLATL